MNRHTYIFKHCMTAIVLTFIIVLSIRVNTYAAVTDIPVSNGMTAAASVNVGDTGSIKPDLSYIEDQSTLSNFTYSFESYDTEFLTVDNNGTYTAISPGTATVNVRVYSIITDYDDSDTAAFLGLTCVNG